MAAHTAIRWTIEAAAREFGLDKETLTKRIVAGGVLAGADKMFSTRDICSAVFGDIEGEKLRTERHRANLLEMDEQERKGALLKKSEVYDQIDKLGIELKANIMACNISEDEKRDILKTMQANLAKI
jgi:hypothetical protein